MTRTLLVLAVLSCVAASAPALRAAENPYAPDTPEAGSVDSIAAFTTSPEYLPASVSYVPASETVPSPTRVLGHLAGAPNELSDTATIYDYYRKLAAASPRVRLEKIGTSVEGRDILLVLISDEANLAKIDRWREINAKLADPRTTGREEALSLAGEGRVIYYLMGGLHSTETGPPEMLMELAYRLAVSERPEIREIRADDVVLITPVMEPDGRDRVVQWYYRHLKGRDLPFEELDEFNSPPYWGHYILHDNNRDGIQLTLPLTRAVNDTYWKYHPQVIHDLHESIPLLYVMTGHGPYTDAVDPVTVGEWTQFAYHDVSELQAQGLPGVWTWGFWDGWWPGYLFSVANNHNSIGRFYETFGNSMAGTFERDLSRRSFAGKPVTEVQWYNTWPPHKKITWSLRDNTNYMEAGVLSALGYAAKHRQELLTNFWIKGNRAVDRGKSEAPFAWAFPADQRDPARLAYLLNQLVRHGIELHRLTADFAAADTTWAAGTYVVRMDQPYRNAAINFLEKQKFPADEPNPPYDDVAWTFGLMYGVDGSRVNDKEILEAAMEPVTDPVLFPGDVKGEGDLYLLEDTGQTSLLSARVLLGKYRIEAAETTFTASGVDYPEGSWIVHAPKSAVDEAADRLGLSFVAARAAPDVPRHDLDLPRIGVYHTWTSTQDCGWVRYTFDRSGIAYTLLNDGDLRKGGLRSRFDVILFPNTWGDFTRIVHGIDPKYGPLAYTKTAKYPSHGIPDASPDITGGMGFEGLLNLQAFLRGGGVFVAMANAGTLPVEGGLVRNVRTMPRGAVRTPGSVLRAKIMRRSHPITYGYPDLTHVFRGNGPLYDLDKLHRKYAVVQFGTKKVGEDEEENSKPQARSGPDGGSKLSMGGGDEGKPEGNGKPSDNRLVLSGYVKGEGTVNGKPAVLDVPAGKGRVILFAFNPMHRYLNLSDFRFVYNVILNWNDLPPAAD
jgi:hypothetical protein